MEMCQVIVLMGCLDSFSEGGGEGGRLGTLLFPEQTSPAWPQSGLKVSRPLSSNKGERHFPAVPARFP